MTSHPLDLDGTAWNALTAVDATTSARLHARLVHEATADRLLDLSYRTVDSPVGTLMLAKTERGLVRVAFDVEDHDRVLADLARRVSPRILRDPGRLDDVATQLEEYFGGRRTRFETSLDLRLSQGFRREVLLRLVEIDFGTTASYTEVAASAGRPRAVRAVGSACAGNPLPIIVPCHRVLRSDGTLGGYLGGLEAKSSLLALEASVTGG